MELFQFHPSAESDLAEIIDYIGKVDFDAAVRALVEFEQLFPTIGRNPAIGHIRPDLDVGPMRFQAIWKYLVVYDPDSKPVTIIAVVHGMRDPAKIIDILLHR